MLVPADTKIVNILIQASWHFWKNTTIRAIPMTCDLCYVWSKWWETWPDQPKDKEADHKKDDDKDNVKDNVKYKDIGKDNDKK